MSSMTQAEAIEVLENGFWWDLLIPVTTIEGRDAEDKLHEALDLALTALRGPTREMVEKVWKSEWIDNGEKDPNGVPKTFAISCKRCGSSAGTSWMRFCPACGAPMTDEAVQMVMERLEALHGET